MNNKKYLNNRDFIRIEGHPNYIIHQNGTILRLWKGKSKQMKLGLTKGYLRLGLYNKSKPKHYFVHRLLALTYIPNPENKPFIDHIFGKEKGNNLNNLRWATIKENRNNNINPYTSKKITKGTICKTKYGYTWYYNHNGKHKSKGNKSKEFLIKYRLDLFREMGVDFTE